MCLEANEPKIFSLFSPLMFMTKRTPTQKCYQEGILSDIEISKKKKTRTEAFAFVKDCIPDLYLCFCSSSEKKTFPSSEDKWDASRPRLLVLCAMTLLLPLEASAHERLDF